MVFATNLAQNNTHVDKCPYLSYEQKRRIIESTKESSNNHMEGLKGENMTPEFNNKKELINLLISLEKQRADELIRIEKARLDMQLEYEQKRIELLNKNKESYVWLEECRSDLRKELVSFKKKSIPDIHAALSDGKVSDELINMWLEEISKLYLNDINLALRMIAVDIDELNQNLFKEIIEPYEKRFKDILENLSGEVEKLLKDDIQTETKPESESYRQ